MVDSIAIGQVFREFVQAGESLQWIAKEAGISTRTVRRYIDAARSAEALKPLPRHLPRTWLPLMPCGALTPQTTCDHDRIPIPRGSARYCVVCHRSGCDGHHELVIRRKQAAAERKKDTLAARRWARKQACPATTS